jgi:hypothetical protein
MAVVLIADRYRLRRNEVYEVSLFTKKTKKVVRTRKESKIMKIQVIRYTASYSPLVQAFVNVEIDGWLTFVGLNLLRDGSLQPAQLSYFRDGKKHYLDAIEITDPDLRALVQADIVDAIRQHLENLPPDERSKPPRPPRTPQRPARPPVPPATRPPLRQAQPIPRSNGKPVAPPVRLLPDRRPLFRAVIKGPREVKNA